MDSNRCSTDTEERTLEEKTVLTRIRPANETASVVSTSVRKFEQSHIVIFVSR
jgi:hypothetical protein